MTAADIDDIDEAANGWRILLDSGNATDADRHDFAAWLAADPRHCDVYAQVSAAWRMMAGAEDADLPSDFFAPSMREKLGDAAGAALAVLKRPTAIGFALAGAAAACLALFITVPLRQTAPIEGLAAATPASIAYQTAIGEIRTETLADGSAVTLGADSMIEVVLSEGQRSVRLAKGEVFFDVARNPDRPFLIAAGDARVRVLGTSFDVQRKADVVRVGVAEGEVRVSYPLFFGTSARNEQGGNSAGSTMRLRRTLTAGQQVAASPAAGLGQISPVSPDAVGAWRERVFVYDGATLAELTADANRYHERRIIITDPAVAELKVTATFAASEIDRTLAALAGALSISMERTGDGDIVLSAQPRN